MEISQNLNNDTDKDGIEIDLIAIGNSKGFRIPKAIREQIGLNGKATLTVANGALHITPVKRKAREGWAENIREIQAKYGYHDPATLECEYIETEFDKKWEW